MASAIGGAPRSPTSITHSRPNPGECRVDLEEDVHVKADRFKHIICHIVRVFLKSDTQWDGGATTCHQHFLGCFIYSPAAKQNPTATSRRIILFILEGKKAAERCNELDFKERLPTWRTQTVIMFDERKLLWRLYNLPPPIQTSPLSNQRRSSGTTTQFLFLELSHLCESQGGGAGGGGGGGGVLHSSGKL